MDRRYYLAKFGVLVIAVTLAFASSGMSGARMAHAVGSQARYSAPAQMQDAAWRAASSAARLIVCTASRALHNIAEVAP
jgi:hypothetical protein